MDDYLHAFPRKDLVESARWTRTPSVSSQFVDPGCKYTA